MKTNFKNSNLNFIKLDEDDFPDYPYHSASIAYYVKKANENKEKKLDKMGHSKSELIKKNNNKGLMN